MKNAIVIGAGILGASTAHHLAKLGAKVTVIDNFEKGRATDAAAGIICPWISQRRNKAWYTLAKNGAKFYQTLIPELEQAGEANTGYEKVGAISIHKDIEKVRKIEERAHTRKIDAPEIGEIKLLTPEETKQLFPVLDDGYYGLFISGAARVDGSALRDTLITRAKKMGAQFINGKAELVLSNGSTIKVKVENEVFLPDKIVITTGAWAKELVASLGLNFKMHFQKGQIVHLELPNKKTKNWPVIIPPNDQYLLTFGENKIVLGATHENDKEFDDTNITAGGILEVLSKGMAIAPGLSDATFEEVRVGFRPFTPGFLPVIGQVKGFEQLYMANGLGASGLTVGPYLGYQLAKLVLNQVTDIDLELYDVNTAIDQL